MRSWVYHRPTSVRTPTAVFLDIGPLAFILVEVSAQLKQFLQLSTPSNEHWTCTRDALVGNCGEQNHPMMKSMTVVVVGGGVVGFSTAVCIAEALPYCSVTLIADRFTPDTTSDVAAGILICSPFPDIPLEQQQRWFKESIDHLLAIAQSEQASEAGVLLSSGFRKAGGQVVKQKVNDLQELSSQGYDVIVNCSGLGAKSLVGDSQVYPVRGQVLKVQAPWLQHFIRDGEGQSYIYPGMHSVTVGGTRQVDDWRLEVDPEDSQDILERCSSLEPSLSRARVLGESVGLRPSRKNVRVEREMVLLGSRQVPVVHNYGHGGWGVSLSWGTALEALGLVRKCLHERPPRARL
ncbi:D-aspartate oxidase isoform X4 [Oncorhynchus keta]|uniref:D-aspartate oxidase isoform X4 n=1 Tax=Oncorhynchus keta TaxID=8018 RepID=UPI0015FA9947|nr:D-aspartate oxidase isoform X4 [Oncorhynchus keta]